MKRTSSPLFFILSVTFLISCGQQAEVAVTKDIPQSKSAKNEHAVCELIFGWDPWEPYQYLTPDNQVRGLEIDLITIISKEAGCKVSYVQNNWMNLLKGIRNGSVDILGGASKTASREKFAYFSKPYRHESFVLYVRADKESNSLNKSLTQLLENQFKLGITEDYLYGDEVEDILDNEKLSSQVISVPITEMNYYNTVQNQIDGFLEDPFVAAYTIKRKGLSDQIKATSINLDSGDVSFMFSKSSVTPEIVEAFNKGLEKIITSGKYQEILDKYSH